MGEAAPKENTMEDILASIRKIISSEDAKASDSTSAASSGDGAVNAQPSAMPQKPVSLTSFANEKPQTPVRDQSPAGEYASSAPTSSGKDGSLANLVAGLSSKKGVEQKSEQPGRDVSTPDVSTPIVNRSVESNAPAAAGSFAALAQQVKKGEVTPVPMAKPVETAVPKVQTREIEKIENAEPASTVEPVHNTVETKPTSLSDIQKNVEVARPADHVLTVAGDEKEETPPLVSSSKKQDEEAQVSAFKEALVSPTTQKSVTGSMDRLKKSVADLDSAQVEGILRPMLKEWLDNNLPGMVEKMVQSEIDRIAKTPD